MIPTTPMTPGHSTPRQKYPNSTRYWQDRRTQRIDLGLQNLPSSPPALMVTRATPRVSSARTTSCYISSPLQCAQQRQPGSSDAPALSSVVKMAPIELSDEQKVILELVKAGGNVFFTGAAGTGKSVLLRAIIGHLRTNFAPNAVAVTATTGIAGVNIGGSTVHSFAGIRLGKETAAILADNIKRSTSAMQRWRRVKVLIVDEISMMDGQLFDKLEYVARVVRKCPKPFGGIQLVLSGDFFQLPPVPEQSYEYRMPSTYAFDAASWSRCITQHISLKQVFRQTDTTFVDILSSMRVGVLLAEHIDQLQRLSRPLHYDDGIMASEILSLRTEVEACNDARLAKLPGPEYIYRSTDRAGYDCRHNPITAENANRLLERIAAIPTITLKLGAQVMLIQNIVQKVLVNGSAGKVIGFLTIRDAVARNIRVAKMPDIPRRKLDEPAPPDPDLRPLNNNVFGHKEKWPLVRFTNGRELVCAPLEFTVEGFLGNTEASRLQVPLILAWALSVHKSQGQTLTRLKVDLGRTFEKGQAYVAVSRATTMEHLEIVNFQPSKYGLFRLSFVVLDADFWSESWLIRVFFSGMNLISRKAWFFNQEMDSEEQYWNNTDYWNNADKRNDIVEILPP